MKCIFAMLRGDSVRQVVVASKSFISFSPKTLSGNVRKVDGDPQFRRFEGFRQSSTIFTISFCLKSSNSLLK